MFTMETTNRTHFQLYIQITHYADISRYCTGSHLTRSFIVLLVTCYQVTILPAGKKIFSCFGND